MTEKTSGNGKETISIREAAKRLGVAESTVYEGIRRGSIPSIAVGERRVVIPRAAFERMLSDGGPKLEAIAITRVVLEIRRQTLLTERAAIDAQLRVLEDMAAHPRQWGLDPEAHICVLAELNPQI